MKNKTIQAWKNADASAKIETPLADVSVNESVMLKDVTGGASSGYICGYSAEVTGRSCNPFSWLINMF